LIRISFHKYCTLARERERERERERAAAQKKEIKLDWNKKILLLAYSNEMIKVGTSPCRVALVT